MRFLLAAAAAAGALAQTCGRFQSPSPAGPTYTFDVTRYASAQSDYQWADQRAYATASSGSNYTYTFNVCQPVNNIPPACANILDQNVQAFQWAPQAPPASTAWCASLSQVGAQYGAPAMSLLDASDPSYGFNISFPGITTNCARAFHLIFRCGYDDFPAPNVPPASGQASTVGTFITEVFDCHYEAYSWSKAGCPLGASAAAARARLAACYPL